MIGYQEIPGASYQAMVGTGYGRAASQAMAAPLRLLVGDWRERLYHDSKRAQPELREAIKLLSKDTTTYRITDIPDFSLACNDWVFWRTGSKRHFDQIKKITFTESKMEIEAGSRAADIEDALKRDFRRGFFVARPSSWTYKSSGNIVDSYTLKRYFATKAYQFDSDLDKAFNLKIYISRFQADTASSSTDDHDHAGTTGTGPTKYHSDVGNHAEYSHIDDQSHLHDAEGAVDVPIYYLPWGDGHQAYDASEMGTYEYERPTGYVTLTEGDLGYDYMEYLMSQHHHNAQTSGPHGHGNDLPHNITGRKVASGAHNHAVYLTSGEHAHYLHLCDTRSGSNDHTQYAHAIFEESQEITVDYGITESIDDGHPYTVRAWINDTEITGSPFEDVTISDSLESDITDLIVFSDGSSNLLEIEATPYGHSDPIKLRAEIEIVANFFSNALLM